MKHYRTIAIVAIHLAAWLTASTTYAHAEIFSDGFEPSCDTDSDTDRLVDCLEALVYRTDPNNPDTDGDGLSDGDEILGTLNGLPLQAMGVNPLRKDILIEYDWIDDAYECNFHSHRPTPEILSAITTMFANSPIQNPDGSTGINIIHDFGQGGEFTGGNLIPGVPQAILHGTHGDAFQGYKAANFATNRQGYFHYALVAHRYDDGTGYTASSGWGDLPGDDLLVTLYCYHEIPGHVAKTIAHELGHNLGLHHGGDGACNQKPNYNSIMNYRYQFLGVDANCNIYSDGVMDFSHGDRIPLNENNLNEHVGVCGNLGAATTPVDWNFNGIIEAFVSYDTNSNESTGNQMILCGGVLSTLHDFDDWSNLMLNALPPPGTGAGSPPPVQQLCPPPPSP